MLLNRKISLIIFAGLTIFASVVYADSFSVFKGKINANSINVRLDATTSSPVACTLARGSLVEVTGEAYDWYKIRLPKVSPAYIKKDLVECINTDNLKECLNAKIIAERVNIRFGPSESSWILGKADKLTVVNILANKGDWYKIEPVHESYGWVNKKFIEKNLDLVNKEEQPVIATEDMALSHPVVLAGKISPYGVVLWRKATHKLITADNKIYFLKGNRKGLDSLNYHQVKVTGQIITPLDSKYPIIEVAIIEALN